MVNVAFGIVAYLILSNQEPSTDALCSHELFENVGCIVVIAW